jgi:tetratricopeptide (TPR) repeat protein
MSAHRVVTKIIVTSALSASLAGSLSSHAKEARNSRTVGDLLRRIEQNTRRVDLNKSKTRTALPKFKKKQEPVKRVDLYQVKPPPRSMLYYEEGTNEAQLERVTDEGMRQLFKLTQQFKTSKRRGELWLRLAELYVEKARLIEYRLQQKYDDQIRAFQKGESKVKPKLDLVAAQDYNRKAVQLYEWYLRDFPNDPKVDQALFFLGYNYFELNQPEKGRDYYQQLTQKFPGSPYVEESNFALGEYHFEREQWADALKYYSAVAKNRRARLYSFALYKIAWCQYKTGQVKPALASLERVIRAGRVAKGSNDTSAGGASRIRLATEAQRDLVVFYAESGTAQNARAYFEEIAGEKAAFGLLEKLAYYYADTGNREGARYIFKDLIAERPNAPKAYDYQYQIVTMYVSAEKGEVFRTELFDWIQTYSPGSTWAEANKKDKELVARANQLIETTLRNHILQQHQTAQNSRVLSAQKSAKHGYELYFNTFKSGAKLDEMHFFYAELLFDMGEFEQANIHYNWVIENAPNSAYFEKASLNTVLAAERGLPKEEDLKKMVGESVDPVAFNSNIQTFETAATRYMKAFPKAENVPAMKYKLGALYYYHNQFDKALASFNGIIKDYPKSPYAKYSANLTLDIFNLKKDYGGLETAGQQILDNPELADSEVGNQVKTVIQRAQFKKAQDLEAKKDYAGAAGAYEEFSKKYAGGELGTSAAYNAAVNFERTGDLFKATSMYALVLADKNPKNEKIRRNSNQYIAGLYEKTGQYERAARAFEEYAAKNSKEKQAIAFLFNAAVIRDGLNNYNKALENYQKYFDTSRAADRFESVWLMAKMQDRRGKISAAQSLYKQYYEQAGNRIPAQRVEAAWHVARIFTLKGRRNDAEEWYKKVIYQQKQLNTGTSFAAEAKYIMVAKTFDELRAIHIPADPAKQGAAVNNKLAVLNRLKEQLKDVIKYDDGPMIVNSLALIGQAYQHMAAAIYAVPLPKGLDEGGKKQYMAGVEGIAQPFEKEAISNYETAIKRGQELEGYSEGLKIANRELARLNKDRSSDNGERAVVTKLPDLMDVDDESDLSGPFKSKEEKLIVDAVSKRLGKDENDLKALNTLAVFYFEQKKYGLARILLNRGLKAHKAPGLHNNLAIIFLAEEKQRPAIASLREAMSLKSGYAIGAANLGSIFVEYKDYKRAVELLADGYSAVKSNLKSGVALDVANNYAVALAGTGQASRAKDIYQNIIKSDGGNVTALLNYSILLIYKLKDKKEGEKQLNRVKFLVDDDAKARKVIEDLEKALGEH